MHIQYEVKAEVVRQEGWLKMTKRFVKILGLMLVVALFAVALPAQAFAGEKMASFISDPRWEQGSTWSSTQYPKLSVYQSYQGSKA